MGDWVGQLKPTYIPVVGRNWYEESVGDIQKLDGLLVQSTKLINWGIPFNSSISEENTISL